MEDKILAETNRYKSKILNDCRTALDKIHHHFSKSEQPISVNIQVLQRRCEKQFDKLLRIEKPDFELTCKENGVVAKEILEETIELLYNTERLTAEYNRDINYKSLPEKLRTL